MHYRRLYLGEIEAVTLFISPADTNAPDMPMGVYRMEAADFRTICDALAEHHDQSGEVVAARADASGIGSRWFRLSDPVAAWLAKQTPLTVVEDYIG